MILAINQIKNKIRSAFINTPSEDIYFTISQAPNRSNVRVPKYKLQRLITKNYSYNRSELLIPGNIFIFRGPGVTNSFQITVTKVISKISGYKIPDSTNNIPSPTNSLSPEDYLKRLISDELNRQNRLSQEATKNQRLSQTIKAINNL